MVSGHLEAFSCGGSDCFVLEGLRSCALSWVLLSLGRFRLHCKNSDSAWRAGHKGSEKVCGGPIRQGDSGEKTKWEQIPRLMCSKVATGVFM